MRGYCPEDPGSVPGPGGQARPDGVICGRSALPPGQGGRSHRCSGLKLAGPGQGPRPSSVGGHIPRLLLTSLGVKVVPASRLPLGAWSGRGAPRSPSRRRAAEVLDLEWPRRCPGPQTSECIRPALWSGPTCGAPTFSADPQPSPPVVRPLPLQLWNAGSSLSPARGSWTGSQAAPADTQRVAFANLGAPPAVRVGGVTSLLLGVLTACPWFCPWLGDLRPACGGFHGTFPGAASPSSLGSSLGPSETVWGCPGVCRLCRHLWAQLALL